MKDIKLTLLALGCGMALALMTAAGCNNKSVSPADTTSGSTTPGYNKIPNKIMTPDTAETRAQTSAPDPAIDSLLEKARILRQSGKPTEAKPLAERAMTLAENQRAWQQLLNARQELSFEERLSGNYDRVLQLRLANLETVRKHREAFPQNGDKEEWALQYVGAAYSWKRDYDSAIRYCREDLAVSEAYDRAAGSPSALVPRALQRLGINLYLAGQYPESEQRMREGYKKYLAFIEVTHATQAAWYYENQVEVLRWLQRVLVAQKRFEEALEMAELGRSRALAAIVATRMSGPDLGPAAPSVEKARAIARGHAATVVEYSLLYEYDPDLLFIFSNFEDIPATSIYTWVVQPDGKITFHESAIPRQGPSLVQIVRQARYSVGAYGRGVISNPEPDAPKARPLQDLYNLLIAPIAAELPRDPDQVVTFVLQDWLFMVPFAALQDGKGHYLIEQHSMSAVPSLAILDLTHQELTAGRKGKGVLIVGNPAMPSLSGGPGEPARPLNSLPGAEREARAVALRFHATPLIGAAASKDEVLRRLPNAGIVHLATHGLLDQTTGGYQSALALAPKDGDSGFLTTLEIQNLKLDADLVVLSACDTGRGKMSGDGILGLSRSFLTAGTPSLMVSLWSITDSSTAYLMDRFYQRLQQGQNKAQSLRGAMLDTMQKDPAPGNWAAFTLLGETAVAPSSHSVTGDAAPLSAKQVQASSFTFPLPANIRELREEPEPEFDGTASKISYQTTMTVTELFNFYKRELEKRGLTEDRALENVEAQGFALVYRGPWGDREVVVGGSDFSKLGSNTRSVTLGFEVRRDPDSEFSPAVNEKRAGLTIPPHATGVDITSKFDPSARAGDITFLSTMTTQELCDFYRPVFSRMGFTEYPLGEEKHGEDITWEFHGPIKDRALFLHVEKSFFRPERHEVHIRFDRPSK